LDPGVEELSDGVEGMTFPDGRVILSEETYRGAHDGLGRPRFTVVHECYHGIRHREQIRRALIDSGELVLCRRQIVKPFRDPEWQANAFSGALLMPAPMVRMLAAKQSRSLLPATMREEFGVSTQAAEVRLQVLKI
jgi:Zn-dependent peptidase ImmA (M78 family)